MQKIVCPIKNILLWKISYWEKFLSGKSDKNILKKMSIFPDKVFPGKVFTIHQTRSSADRAVFHSCFIFMNTEFMI